MYILLSAPDNFHCAAMLRAVALVFALGVLASEVNGGILDIFSKTKSVVNKADLFELPIVHYNDFHARFEQTSWTSGECKAGSEDGCVGGFARLYTAVTREMSSHPNSILLNAGDNFQGTLWYTLFKWNVTVEFMNKLPHDAMGLGNHEFDDKIAGVVPYLDELKCPVLAANIDDSEEPTFQNKVKDYIVITRAGRKIGIIGYMLSTTDQIASTEKLKFTDEIAAVKRVVAELKEQEDVNILIGLSHSGIDVDRRVAEAVPELDVIVGGHSHTLLYTGTPPGGDSAYDVYPMEVAHPSGHKVLVVQAAAYSKYLGKLTVFFDENGEATTWEGNPIILDATIPEDPAILEEMKPWTEEVAVEGGAVIGSTKVFLDATLGACSKGECNIGNMLADAMAYEALSLSTENGSWTAASIAVTNSGGIRTSIDEIASSGVITLNDLVLVQPFQNTFDTVELQGKHILEMLEFQVSNPDVRTLRNKDFSTRAFLQWSGIQVTFDVAMPVNQRVKSEVMILCSECRVPKYEPLVPDKWYRIMMNSFLADGKDGYTVIHDNLVNRTVGRVDIEVLTEYITKTSPLTPTLDGRIKVTEGTGSGLSVLPSLLLLVTAVLGTLWAH